MIALCKESWSHRQGGEGHFERDPISPCRDALLLRVSQLSLTHRGWALALTVCASRWVGTLGC
jgi:hypothetical protein